MNGKILADINRRRMLQLGAGVTWTLIAPNLWMPMAAAAESVGTWPAGVTKDSVFVGITTPLTGTYSEAGKDELRGYQLAFEQINAGDAAAHEWGLKAPGVLGRKIRYGNTDSETKPNPAVQAQSRYISQDKAIMITGSVSSATAAALNKLAERERVLYMAGVTASNATTGKDCTRYGFRSQAPAYMLAQALAPTLVKELGNNKKVAYLVPDYTYGTSMFESMQDAVKSAGWTTVSKQLAPLGTTDFSSALINIANSDADIFVNITFGNDSISSSKQSKQFGVLSKMTLVVPNISPFQYENSGGEMAGVYGAIEWIWELGSRFPLSKAFTDTFAHKFGYKPKWPAEVAYTQSFMWALAVQRAGTFNPVKVIKALESDEKINSTLGPVYYTDYSHQLVRPVPVVRGKHKSEMKSADDQYQLLELVSGEQIVPPKGLFGCHLGSY